MLGATGGALALHSVAGSVPSFTVIGITALSDYIYLGAGAIGGAMLAKSFLKKDDLRLEPGPELVVMLDDTTMDAFEAYHPLSHNHTKDLAPEDAYDKFGEIKSLPLNELKSSDKEEKSDLVSSI